MLSFKPLYGFRAKMMLEILHWGSPNLKVCEMGDWTVVNLTCDIPRYGHVNK